MGNQVSRRGAKRVRRRRSRTVYAGHTPVHAYTRVRVRSALRHKLRGGMDQCVDIGNKTLVCQSDKIGSGGFGTVYGIPGDANLCVKVSNKQMTGDPSTCRRWRNEYDLICQFMKRITTEWQFVRIVNPISFVESDTLCHMVMPRVYRPDHKPGPTIQALLGESTYNLVDENRGEILGLAEILSLVNKASFVAKACLELGSAMATIHFVGRNNALDVELFLGCEAQDEDNMLRFYLADFDQSSNIDDFDDDVVFDLVESLSAVLYFPRKSVDPVLYALFAEGYLHVANQNGFIEIAQQVLDEYNLADKAMTS